MSKTTASLLFPNIPDIKEILNKYPDRPADKIVTRIAPSPTGFLHIGTVGTGLFNQKFARQSGGTFILRIEDTDQARNTTDYENKTGGVYSIIRGLRKFNIDYDEGVFETKDGDIVTKGEYGPYIQSERLDLYYSFAKYLLENDKAYVCFISPEKLEAIRTSQQLEKKMTGIYGPYAISRFLSEEEVISKIQNGEKYYIRYKCNTTPGEKVTFHDEVRGDIEFENNYIDQVLIKSDGFPSFALAHITDDYLMGTTYVLRTDERVPSIPFHHQVFDCFKEVFSRKIWKYGHLSPIQKLDNGNRRKLSKRKDPEADVQILQDMGYPSEGIKMYLLNLSNSNFEGWWRERNLNSNAFIPSNDFQVSLDNCNESGAVFDMQKLNSFCSEYISLIDLETLFEELKTFYNDTCQDKIGEFKTDQGKVKIIHALNIDRNKKLHNTYQDILNYIEPLLADTLEIDETIFPEFINKEKRENLVSLYSSLLSEHFDNSGMLQMGKEERRELTKDFSKDQGFALNKKEFIEGTHLGLISDFAMILRIYLYGKTQTPDIFSMINFYGPQITSNRLSQ